MWLDVRCRMFVRGLVIDAGERHSRGRNVIVTTRIIMTVKCQFLPADPFVWAVFKGPLYS